mmetsp:Transcript_67509/g.175801  ORF Transcript_67509/g.175801 Transcript_67509/m.175801 type:complete len:324 (+) Transcript_67509:1613-2584(+)
MAVIAASSTSSLRAGRPIMGTRIWSRAPCSAGSLRRSELVQRRSALRIASTRRQTPSRSFCKRSRSCSRPLSSLAFLFIASLSFCASINSSSATALSFRAARVVFSAWRSSTAAFRSWSLMLSCTVNCPPSAPSTASSPPPAQVPADSQNSLTSSTTWLLQRASSDWTLPERRMMPCPRPQHLRSSATPRSTAPWARLPPLLAVRGALCKTASARYSISFRVASSRMEMSTPTKTWSSWRNANPLQGRPVSWHSASLSTSLVRSTSEGTSTTSSRSSSCIRAAATRASNGPAGPVPLSQGFAAAPPAGPAPRSFFACTRPSAT